MRKNDADVTRSLDHAEPDNHRLGPLPAEDLKGLSSQPLLAFPENVDDTHHSRVYHFTDVWPVHRSRLDLGSRIRPASRGNKNGVTSG